MTTVSISPATYAFFKAAGVFRVKSDEKARERFNEAFPDWQDEITGISDDEAAEIGRDGGDAMFAALLQRRDDDKAAKIAADVAREERKAAKEAAEKAKPMTGGMDGATDHIRSLPRGAYVLTSAQNNTDVDADFLAALHTYCKRHDAQLLVGRMTYNKSAFKQPDVNETDGIYYADAIKPYLVNGTLDIGGMYFLADANVIPTAKWPTSGFGAESPAGVGLIVPATRIEMRLNAALKGAATKVIAATGTVTKRNYIMRKTGTQAAAAHNIGALFVDTTGDKPVIRHLERMADDKGFYDIDGYYMADRFEPLREGFVAAYQPGDIHAEKAEEINIKRALDLVKRFKPQNILVHDVLDFSSRNHHNIKDPFFLGSQYDAGNTVKGDLTAVVTVLDRIAKVATGTVHIIESNHDLAIDTWLKTTDWRLDPINSDTYLECALAKRRGGSSFNTLEFAYKAIGGGKKSVLINFHKVDESVTIAGVEMGCHGHNGANGAKGSPKQFATLGVPMNTGHTHSPSIYGPVYTAGVLASLEMGYNIGASSWAIADVLTYANGQRQILFA